MAPPKKPIAPELIAEGKRLYELTLTPAHHIAAMMGISRSTFNNRVIEWAWTRRGTNNPALDIVRAVRGTVAATLTASAPTEPGADASPAGLSAALPPTLPADIVQIDVALPAQRLALAARIQGVVENQMDAIDRVLKVLGPSEQGEAERTARTLASLARTLREIAALTQPDEGAPPDDADDDPIPRDIDEFRNELARRIHGLIEARKAGPGGTADRAAAGPDAERDGDVPHRFSALRP